MTPNSLRKERVKESMIHTGWGKEVINSQLPVKSVSRDTLQAVWNLFSGLKEVGMSIILENTPEYDALRLRQSLERLGASTKNTQAGVQISIAGVNEMFISGGQMKLNSEGLPLSQLRFGEGVIHHDEETRKAILYRNNDTRAFFSQEVFPENSSFTEVTIINPLLVELMDENTISFGLQSDDKNGLKMHYFALNNISTFEEIIDPPTGQSIGIKFLYSGKKIAPQFGKRKT